MVTKADLSLVAARATRRFIVDPTQRKDVRRLIQALKLTSFVQGNFYIVTLSDDEGNVLGAGASKRMPHDFNDDGIGYNLALIRAVELVVSDYVALKQELDTTRLTECYS